MQDYSQCIEDAFGIEDAFKMGCNRYCNTVGVYSNLEETEENIKRLVKKINEQ